METFNLVAVSVFLVYVCGVKTYFFDFEETQKTFLVSKT